MDVRALSIDGAWELTPRQHGDDRGVFLEWYKATELEEATGRSLNLRQANMSVSARGTLRGVHFADVPPSQAKYVTCPRGAVLDVVVDVRVGSPTFGRWEAVLLDDVDRRAVFLSEGLGHAFLALEDDSVVTYLCSAPYAPGREHGIHPLDDTVAIEWPTQGRDGQPLEYQLSAKDAAAPSLTDAASAGLLPTFEAATAFVSGLGVRPPQA